MHISYKPLWHTLIERNMRKEDLRLAAGLTTNIEDGSVFELVCREATEKEDGWKNAN